MINIPYNYNTKKFSGASDQNLGFRVVKICENVNCVQILFHHPNIHLNIYLILKSYKNLTTAICFAFMLCLTK